MADRIFQSDVARTESQIRHDLKIAHRLIARYGMDDLVWNHISARCLDEQTADCCELPSSSYLITPGGMHFSEIRAEDLVFDSIEESGNVIHSGIYQARPDVRCIIHIHTPAIMVVSVLEEGFKFLTQDSAPFYKRIGYHKYEGIHSADDEKDRISASLGKDGIALIMRNHGATVVGRSIQEAWVRTYYLDRCCKVQIDAMRTGGKLIECSDELLVHAQKQIDKYFPHGKFEWGALKRLVDK
jgi:ribulose-5-phosphate 4-epimerase/fuculose-1-phosphate aldolase